MSDVQTDSPGTQEAEKSSGIECADPAYPDSELVPDQLSERAHRLLDEKVLRRYTWIDDSGKDEDSIYSRVTLLRSLARDYDQLSPQLTNTDTDFYYDPRSVIRTLFKEHPWLVSVLNECWRKGSFRTIRLLKILQRNVSSVSFELRVVEHSWDRKFEGPAVDVLLQTISTYLTRTLSGSESSSSYAHCAPLVNSSGTGKSRMVDELSKRIVTIPMCLRADRTQGFPPSDDLLRLWLQVPMDYNRLSERQRLCEFVVSLLTITKERLERIEFELSGTSILRNELDEEALIKRQERLASAFRDHMRDGRNFKHAGQYRREFFEEVIDRIKDRIAKIKRSPNDGPPKPDIGRLQQAGENLVNFIFPPKGSLWENELRRPIVILAFDEAHELAPHIRGMDGFRKDEYWTHLSELRYVLRELHDLPIFTLFLSTSASKFQPLNDHGIKDLPLITFTNFDVLAYVVEEGVTTLDEVTQEKWMCHLGRPLFAADCDSRETLAAKADGHNYDYLLRYAASELVCGRPEYVLKPPALLACVSVRFALEFTRFDREMEATLVESHLRLVLGASPGLVRLSTAAGSEPLLAKAAANTVYYTDRAVKILVDHMNLRPFGVHCGERGELVSSFLVMQAQDMAQASQAMIRRLRLAGIRREWVYVREFMQALLTPDDYNALMAKIPAYHLPDDQDASFATTFDDAKIWFNHVIRVKDCEMIHASHLWKAVSRGGMIICAPRHHDLDLVLPVCFKGNTLARDNMTAILIHIKLDKCDPRDFSNEDMDPFDVGLFSKGDKPLPVIRMVFALGPGESGVIFPAQQNTNSTSSFTSYDVWCAGLSPGTFACIGDDLSAYRAVLEQSL